MDLYPIQKVLIVDDMKENLLLLRKILKDLQAEIIEANSGYEALNATLDHKFALAIIDVMMPGMSGFSLAEHLRKDDATGMMPIIFVSGAYQDEQHIFNGYEAGCYDYITKPYKPYTLLAKVRVFLEIDRQRQELQNRHDQLETVVSERTRDLEIANIELKTINRELEDLNNTLESRISDATNKLKIANKQQRKLSAHLENVREEERRRISRSVHDELGQALIALKFELAILKKDPSISEAGLAGVESINKRISAIMLDVRRIAADLRPSILDDLGLCEALKWRAKEFTEHTGIACLLDLCDPLPSLSFDQSTALFRITLEALTNIFRHSGATQVNISASIDKENLVFKIADNGCGISSGQITSENSLGLMGMKERAELCGGTLIIEGNQINGTVIIIHVPF